MASSPHMLRFHRLWIAFAVMAATACGTNRGNDAVDVPEGGLCAASDECESQFCQWPDDHTCGDGTRGRCVAKVAQACPDILVPVCGCDGKTYANACWAQAGGESVAYRGECH